MPTRSIGPYGDLVMAIKYYEYLKPYGPVRLKRVLINGTQETTVKTLWMQTPPDIEGKGYELRMISVGTIKYNIPLADGEER
ncbi:hypothetical protein RhiJN_21719 [Ceratobasidium sp. AG-Ba]|nr:hypothetical protein RhiJN_21719 [Ceratobasidium sp. AG-Ba]